MVVRSFSHLYLYLPAMWLLTAGGGLSANLSVSGGASTDLFAAGDEFVGIKLYARGQTVADFQPRSALVTGTHLVPKARYPVIDMHCHWGQDVDPAGMIQAMNERGIKKVINLSGDWGVKLDQMLSKYHQFAPDRFLIFCSPDFGRINELDFSRNLARFIEQAHAKGAAGVKIYKSLGLTVKDSSGKLIEVDDPRLDPIWAQAGALKMPVLIHTADPVAFFEPIDRFNERWLQLNRHPTWSFYGPQYPARAALLAQRNRVIAKHPQTTFIGAHVGNSAEDLESLGQLLDKYPNFYVDISGRVAELGRQPYTARKFIIRFQDRVLFGTDRYPGRPDQPRYRIYYRFLETQDEYFDYYQHPFPPTGQWKIYGVYLPDDVLKKIYYQNAERILGTTP